MAMACALSAAHQSGMGRYLSQPTSFAGPTTRYQGKTAKPSIPPADMVLSLLSAGQSPQCFRCRIKLLLPTSAVKAP
jgi:hypothetical protein